MRVSMTKLREAGRMIPVAQRKQLRGTLSTKRFKGGDAWFKVLELEPSDSYPGQHQLYEPRLKECIAEKNVLTFSGLALEDGAWVVQEWEIDVAPETPVGRGWLKPERRCTSRD